MAKIESKGIEIGTPVSEPFAVANDQRKVLDHMESFTKSEPTTEKGLGVGSHVTFISQYEVPGQFLGAMADKPVAERANEVMSRNRYETQRG